jgi:hypothetical protein
MLAPVEPGEYELSVREPGTKAWIVLNTERVTLQPGQNTSLQVSGG